MQIFDESKSIGIEWSLGDIENTDLGKIQFFFNGIWYPRYCPQNYYNLQTVFSNLKASLKDKYFPGGNAKYHYQLRHLYCQRR